MLRVTTVNHPATCFNFGTGFTLDVLPDAAFPFFRLGTETESAVAGVVSLNKNHNSGMLATY